MTFQAVDYLVHFSNVLLLVSYSVRDILWLRWFAVAAATRVGPYVPFIHTILATRKLTLTTRHVDDTKVTDHHAIIPTEQRVDPAELSPDEQRLYDLGFQSLRPREFLSLTLVGEWKSAAAGDKILLEGEPVSRLSIADRKSVV